MDLFDLSKLKSHGEDVRISPLAVISRPELVSVGNHIAIDEFLACTTGLELKDYIHVSKHVAIIGGKDARLVMGNFTNLSVRATIVCGSDEFKGEGLITAPGLPEEYRDRLHLEPIVFEDFVNTGANVTILPGVRLPQGVVIGACSLVRKADVLKPWTIYAGNPLKEIGPRPKEKMLRFAHELGYDNSEADS